MKIPFLTVIYNPTEELYNMSIQFLGMYPPSAVITAVKNLSYSRGEYPKGPKYIENSENCLSRAWNVGLKEIFKEYDYAVVTGMDSTFPSESQIKRLAEEAKKDRVGVTAATPIEFINKNESTKVDIKHGDGSFSFFVISKKCFEDVGDFDENFKPAYFEDNDYLERLWQKGYTPKRFSIINYYHVIQGTYKGSEEVRHDYPIFMQKNLDYFRKKWGKTPEHLLPNIKFG